MSDAAYKLANFVLKSRGISAREVTDAVPEGMYLNMANVEELAENSLSTRLGSLIVNRTGNSVNALPGSVHSLTKLGGLSGSDWRYAGQGENLWRRTGTTQGAYELIASDMSGSPWQAQADSPTDISSIPFIFIADAAGMKKDNGILAAPQQSGIFQPQYPVLAQAQPPTVIVLDNFLGSSTTASGTFSFVVSANQIGTVLTTAAVAATGLQTVSVGVPTAIGLFQMLQIDSGAALETVLVLGITKTGFLANFTKTHASGVAVQEFGWSCNVQASSTATITHAFTGLPVAAWPKTLQQEDYIGAYLNVSDPTQIQSITIKFDCGDGSFNSDYFYKVIAQGPLQNLLNTATSDSTDAATAATDALLNNALGIYGNSAGSIVEMTTGLDNWNSLLIQLSDFAGAGRADFNDPVFNWAAINGYQITITSNDTGNTPGCSLASLILFGGSGPDSFAGVGYDYLFTFLNNVDGTESNPCMVMSNVNPPNNTNWVYPRRQPVQLTLTYPTLDSQTTSLRIYRRGGTLGDNYRRIDEVLCSGSPQTYLDTFADMDIQQADFVSFTNDVPVTSSLPVPVNTNLLDSINPGYTGLVEVFPESMANISIGQQVSLGTIGSLANNFETVVVISFVYGFHGALVGFWAYVQNPHTGATAGPDGPVGGDPVSATAKYGQPVTGMCQAFNQFWYWGDPNNPNYLYWSAKNNPQYVSSAAYVQVSTPDDPIVLAVGYKGNLYVSCLKTGWYSVAPGSNGQGSPTVYPTACKHPCVAPQGWVATEEYLFYQSIDGIRAFAGGPSAYLSQEIEFLWQGIGSSPIVEADQTQFSQTRAAFWNNLVIFSYVGVDGKRHRLLLQSVYKRWRNDDLDAQSLLLEQDTNSLLFGDSEGLIHLDRQDQAFDEGNNAGALVQTPIAMNLQTPYTDYGMPAVKKSFQELTLDLNTAGQTLQVYLWFEDGQVSQLIGSVNTTVREKVNFSLNSGKGFEYYKVSIQIVGSVSVAVYVFQLGLKALPLAKTRLVMDTFWMKFSDDASKILKNIFIEYTATAPITCQCFYDGASTPDFEFTLSENGGVRTSTRVRLPAISFRLWRMICTSSEDFQIWDDSRAEMKSTCVGKGYQFMQFVPND